MQRTMTPLLLLLLISGQPAEAAPLPPGDTLAAQRASVPLLPPALEFWIEEEAARQAAAPAAPAALRARAAAALGARATGPQGDALTAAVITEVYARAAALPAASAETRRTLTAFGAQVSPEPEQQ